MKKTQMVFENFLVAFLFLFIMASGVFLFVGGGAGLDIDFFNRTIYSEPQGGLDFAYVSVYEDGVPDDIDETKVQFDEATNTITFSIKRTAMPPKTEMPVAVKFYVGWDYCDERGCYYKSNQDLQPESFYTVNYAPTLSTHSFTYVIPETKYYDCDSQILIVVETKDDYFNETVLDNNLYVLNQPFCYYPPTDPSISSVCVPLTDSLDADCVSVRTWDAQVCEDVPCTKCDGPCSTSFWTYFSNCPNPRTVDPSDPTNYLTSAPIPKCCRFCFFTCRTICDAYWCNGYQSPGYCCNCYESTCEECRGGGVNQPISTGYNPYLLRVDVANKYHDLEFTVKVELMDENGDYKELSFDFISVESGEGLVQYLFGHEIELKAHNNISLLLDLSRAELNLGEASLIDCFDGYVRVTLELETQDFYEYVLNETSNEPLIELDNNGDQIRTNIAEEFVVFNTSSIDNNIYSLYEGVLDRVLLQEYNSEGKPVPGSFVSLTHAPGGRSYDVLPILYFDSSNNLVGEGFTCAPETISNDVCYCPKTSYVKTYDCGVNGVHIVPEESVDPCTWTESYYDMECLTGGQYEVVETKLQICNAQENCRCVLREQSYSCSCSVQENKDYLLCKSELVPKRLIKYYYYTEVIKDVSFENNVFEQNIHWCVKNE